MARYEVELVRTIRTKVVVEAENAAEIKRRASDEYSGYAEGLFQDGTDDCDGIRVVSVKKAS
jgi:hypothetical protein